MAYFGVGYNSKPRVYLTARGGKLEPAFLLWRNMLARCYNDKNSNYKFYGAKGVRVCTPWHDFQVFARWYESNYVEGYHLDKDKLGDGQIYSPDTCMFLSPKENTRLAHCNRLIEFIKDGEIRRVKNLNEFAKEIGGLSGNLSRVIAGADKHCRGWHLHKIIV